MSGLQARCKECDAERYRKERDVRVERSKKWSRANPEKRVATMRKHKYGLTPEAFEAMLLTQHGKCGICEEPMQPPNVDHCHSTGKIRALLCTHCNRMLGGARDRVELLLKGSAYLNKFLG